MKGQRHFNLIAVAVASTSLVSSCFLFKERSKSTVTQETITTAPVLGLSLGEKAGGEDDQLLQSLYLVETDIAPALVRPDPDSYTRQLLRQYREEGATIARQIGRVEAYRLLLGGASQDFKTPPAEIFDATSLLANHKVAEEICTGLLNPNSTDHPGWSSILPASPSALDQNIRFLAQRFMGLPSDQIETTVIDALKELVDDTTLSNKSYVLPCVALALDADALSL